MKLFDTSSLNQISNVTQNAQTYFNNLSLSNLTVSQNVDDAVVAFFENITETKEGAKAIAGLVILSSLSQGLETMDVIKKFSDMPPSELSAYTAMFLNLNRVGTSYLGITNAPYTNKYVKRLIIA